MSTATDSKSILILGAGFIGMMIAFFAKLSGFKQIIMTEVLPSRILSAKQYFSDVFDGNDTASLLREIFQKTDFKGVDVVFETSGSEIAVDQMISACKVGGTIVQTGFHEAFPQIDMWQIVRKELAILGSYSANHVDFTEVIDMINKRKIFPQDLVTNVISLKDMHKAMPLLLDKDKYLKNIVAL
jgi:L-iditol 2-dehydrogenase